MTTIKEDIETGVEAAWQSATVGQAKKLMRERSGVWMVSGISLIESALPLPLITDPFLVAAILINRANAIRLVIATTIASLWGGLAAYFMAKFFLNALLLFMTPGMLQEFHKLIDNNDSNTFVLTIIGAVTPVPYTMVAWVVAVLKGGLLTFMIASVVGRGFRYTLVAYCTYHFGPKAIDYAKRYIGIVSVVLIILAALFFWWKM